MNNHKTLQLAQEEWNETHQGKKKKKNQAQDTNNHPLPFALPKRIKPCKTQ